MVYIQSNESFDKEIKSFKNINNRVKLNTGRTKPVSISYRKPYIHL